MGQLKKPPRYQKGDVIENLTVESYLGNIGKNRTKKYLCICDCGSERVVEEMKLTRREITACHECVMERRRIERGKARQGEKIGDYTILKATHRRAKNRSIIWEMRCNKCNRIVYARGDDLHEGRLPQCVCQSERSKGAENERY